jgi:hypothetical protein
VEWTADFDFAVIGKAFDTAIFRIRRKEKLHKIVFPAKGYGKARDFFSMGKLSLVAILDYDYLVIGSRI